MTPATNSRRCATPPGDLSLQALRLRRTACAFMCRSDIPRIPLRRPSTASSRCVRSVLRQWLCCGGRKHHRRRNMHQARHGGHFSGAGRVLLLSMLLALISWHSSFMDIEMGDILEELRGCLESGVPIDKVLLEETIAEIEVLRVKLAGSEERAKMLAAHITKADV